MKIAVRFIAKHHLHLVYYQREPKTLARYNVRGSMSTFGGPGDLGVSPTEGLALFSQVDLKNPKHAALFEIEQPVGTTGLARRLNATSQHYIAMRWAYTAANAGRRGPFGTMLNMVTPREWLREATVSVTANGKTVECRPVDFGPNEDTGRVADLSPFTAKELNLRTNDVVTVMIDPPASPAARRAPRRGC